MKVVMEQQQVRRVLALVSRAASSRSTFTFPILSTVLMETDQGRLKLAATDFSLSITCWIGCQIHAEGGVAVPARLLSDFVGSLPNEPVDMELESRTRTLHIQCGRYEAKIKGLDPREFPTIPSIKGNEAIATVDPAALREAIGQVAFAAATEETRPSLTGVYTRIRSGQMVLVAADGFRLARRTIEAQAGDEADVIVPARAMAELGRVLAEGRDPVQIVLPSGLNQILFHTDSAALVSNLVDDRYPNYEAAIPKDHRTRAVMNTRDFLKAVRIASFFARDGTNIIRLELESGRIRVSASAADVGKGVGEVDAKIEGPAGRIALDARYLTEALSVLGAPEVALEMQGPDRPCVIRPEPDDEGHLRHVIMPQVVLKEE
ncbi:MAG: DNA polymerase III subunit beta [Thermoproteota archaeon]